MKIDEDLDKERYIDMYLCIFWFYEIDMLVSIRWWFIFKNLIIIVKI